MHTRQNLAVSLVLAISMVGVSYGAGGVLPGDGLSESTAYLIEDLADFDEFAGNSSYWLSGVYTKLACDPNLTGRPYTTAVIAPDTSTSFGFQGTPFAGILDGNGHIVSNLTIDTTGAGNDYLGLFGKIEGSDAEVKDLGIENINITGGACSKNLGGLCGNNGDWDNYNGTITNCYTTGLVSGDCFFGGLCGRNYGTITNCYAASSVTGGDDSDGLGGLCGCNIDGTIINCYATGAVTGGSYLGGLCGANTRWDNPSGGTITNCYATGSVTSGDNPYEIGGLCGYNREGTITNCFWDVETGSPDNGLGTPKTTDEMQTQSTFTDVNWDFSVAPVWHMPFEAIGYPMLGWQKDIPGDFTGRYGVYMDDFAVFSNAWLSNDAPTANWNEHCDLNANGVIDPGDLKIFADHWLCD